MSTVAESRALARAEHRIALLERDLRLSRERFDRCYAQNAILVRLTQAQASLLVGLRDRDHRRIGKSMEEMVSLRRQLRHSED